MVLTGWDCLLGLIGDDGGVQQVVVNGESLRLAKVVAVARLVHLMTSPWLERQDHGRWLWIRLPQGLTPMTGTVLLLSSAKQFCHVYEPARNILPNALPGETAYMVELSPSHSLIISNISKVSIQGLVAAPTRGPTTPTACNAHLSTHSSTASLIFPHIQSLSNLVRPFLDGDQPLLDLFHRPIQQMLRVCQTHGCEHLSLCEPTLSQAAIQVSARS